MGTTSVLFPLDDPHKSGAPIGIPFQKDRPHTQFFNKNVRNTYESNFSILENREHRRRTRYFLYKK